VGNFTKYISSTVTNLVF